MTNQDWRKEFEKRFVERLQRETDLTGVEGEIANFIEQVAKDSEVKGRNDAVDLIESKMEEYELHQALEIVRTLSTPSETK